MKEAAIPIASGLRVFLCHASQDKRAVRELYERLRIDGFLPWFDKEDLLPGQNWREEIAKAVRASHFVIVCLSRKFNSAGYRQKEVRLALEVADEQPEGKIFLIPAKLEECEVPNGLSRWQWANLFEEDGYQQLQRALATGATAIGIDLLRPSGDASKSSAHHATRTGAVQRLLDLQILEVDDPEITKLLRMPEVLSDLVKRLVTSGGPRLQSMLSGVLSYCLADPSNDLYQQFKVALAGCGAKFQHGSQSPSVRLRGDEEITLLLPVTSQFRYMEIRGHEVTGAATAKLLGIVTSENESDVMQFLNDLYLSKQDRYLLDEGYELDFYWDTSDVREAVLGAAGYYLPSGLFDAKAFSSNAALLRCLLGAGWLGKIRLLPPHMAEFLRFVGSDFGIGTARLPPGGIAQFIRDSGLSHSHYLEMCNLSELSTTEVAKIVHRQAGNAPTLFRVVHCVAHTWETRFVSWVRSGLFELDSCQFDYAREANSTVFQRVRHSLDNIRPKFPVSNFADAMAICMLASQVRDFSKGKSRRVPCFFASSRIYQKALTEAGLEGVLQYNFRGRIMTVLRDEGYYMLRATLNPPAALRSSPQFRGFANSFEELCDLVENLQQSLGRAPFWTATLEGQQLAEAVRSLKLFWFLENIWLPYSGSIELTAAIQEYVETPRRLEQVREFRESIEFEIAKAVDLLKSDLQEYQRSLKAFQSKLETGSHGPPPGLKA